MACFGRCTVNQDQVFSNRFLQACPPAENSAYSFHMADVGTDNMEREKAYFFATREGKYVTFIEQALERIENGTYGICMDCTDEKQELCPTCPEIPRERLLAVPTATRCVPCKERAEK